MCDVVGKCVGEQKRRSGGDALAAVVAVNADYNAQLGQYCKTFLAATRTVLTQYTAKFGAFWGAIFTAGKAINWVLVVAQLVVFSDTIYYGFKQAIGNYYKEYYLLLTV